MICENCEAEHDGEYGSGRFCSSKCAKGFSTKSKRDEINKKVSDALKGRRTNNSGFKKGFDERRKIFSEDDRKRAIAVRSENMRKKYSELDFIDLPMSEKRRIVLHEQEGKCFECGIDEWLKKPITLELHHIDGDNTRNERENLVFLCPNCHSQTDSWRKRITSRNN